MYCTTKIRFFTIYLNEGMNDPSEIICAERYMYYHLGRHMRASTPKQRSPASRYQKKRKGGLYHFLICIHVNSYFVPSAGIDFM